MLWEDPSAAPEYRMDVKKRLEPRGTALERKPASHGQTPCLRFMKTYPLIAPQPHDEALLSGFPDEGTGAQGKVDDLPRRWVSAQRVSPGCLSRGATFSAWRPQPLSPPQPQPSLPARRDSALSGTHLPSRLGRPLLSLSLPTCITKAQDFWKR